ncbi:flagellin [Lysinibacillus parviboronicapiens]|uniref:flagellin n=1 Tax=Lysinibacillus parviboronicapiens TaxID=436516 RepID=UPI002E167526
MDNVSLYVPKECSKYGAYQNALEHILNNVRTTKENLTSAQSKIRDTNIIYFTP